MFKKIFLCASLLAISAQANIPNFLEYITEKTESRICGKSAKLCLTRGCEGGFDEEDAIDIVCNIKFVICDTYRDYYWVRKMLHNTDYHNLTQTNKNYIWLSLVVRNMFFYGAKYFNSLNECLYDKLCAQAQKSLKMWGCLEKIFDSDQDLDQAKGDVWSWLTDTGIFNVALNGFLNNTIEEDGAQKYIKGFEDALSGQKTNIRLHNLPPKHIAQLVNENKIDQKHLIDFVKDEHIWAVKEFVETEKTNGRFAEFFVDMFCTAIKNPQSEVLDYFLKQSLDLPCLLEDKNKVLMAAIKVKNQEAVSFLVENYCVTDEDVLFAAIYCKQIGFVEEVLAKKKYLTNVENDEGWTPLQIAMAQKSPELVKLLVENGAAVDRNILFWAIHKGWPEVVECLLKRNKSLLTLKNDKGWTSLQIAVAQKSPELVKLLVENGAAVDRNILFWAIHKGWPEVVKCLLKRNKSLLTLKNDKGWTPLRQAIIEGTPELVKLLVENGAAIDKEAWRSALWRGNLEIVGALLDKKPELLNAENECGRTPLEVADHIKNKKLVEFLLARGARNKVRIEVDPIKELKKSLKKFGIKF